MTPEEWLPKDYELKVKYLTDEFQRMWTRFNFFVTIESALIGGKVIFSHDGSLTRELGFVGAALSLVWYVFGAEDRFLVRIYRRQVADAAERLMAAIISENSSLGDAYRHTYVYVGEIEKTSRELREEDRRESLVIRTLERIAGWRFDLISTTRLASLFPLLTFFAWLGVILWWH